MGFVCEIDVLRYSTTTSVMNSTMNTTTTTTTAAAKLHLCVFEKSSFTQPTHDLDVSIQFHKK